MCCLRKKFAEQFADFTGAGRIYIGDTGAFDFDNISAESLLNVKLKQTRTTHFFII